MAHSRSFRGRGISDSQRRKKKWIQVTGPSGTFIPGGVQTPNMALDLSTVPTSDAFGQSVGLVSDPTLDKVPAESTILRIRGSVNIPKNSQETAGSPQDNINFAIGIGVMEATAANLGAFPNPATPDGAAWDGWMFFRSVQQTALDSNAGIVDVKSMRKVQSGQAIIIVFGSFVTTDDGSTPAAVAGQGTATINIRALILLP